MTQSAAVFSGAAVIHVALPAADDEVLPGVCWGAIDAFPSPAYWAYQVLARRMSATPAKYRLGTSLPEEVTACLLGGHGIPAKVGVAAFHKLQSTGVLNDTPTEDALFDILSQPLSVDNRAIKYRFARQKSHYISSALTHLSIEQPPLNNGKDLRNWLTQLPGVGYKTASWIARNWLDADDVAILDIHILRAGILAGFLNAHLTVEKNYLELESQFLSFAKAIGVRAAELDAVIWFEMMTSPRTVTELMGRNINNSMQSKKNQSLLATGSVGTKRSNKGCSNTYQTRLFN